MNWGAERIDHFASDYYDGMAAAYPERWQKFSGGARSAALIRKQPQLDRVNLVVSAGSGGGPWLAGYVGEGLADAAVGGGPFAAPNAYTLYEVARYLGQSKGVLLLYNNFAGDFLNNDMARELLEMDGVGAVGVPISDDIATAVGEARENRGGRCGAPYIIKAAAHCAAQGADLAGVKAVAEAVNRRTGTISVRVDFEAGEISYGGGFSGEPGLRTETHMDMARLVREAFDMLAEDLRPQPGERLYLLVNRMRYTAYTDGYLAAKHAMEHLSAKYPVEQLRVANFTNILDSYGFTFTMLCAGEALWPHLAGEVQSDSFIL